MRRIVLALACLLSVRLAAAAADAPAASTANAAPLTLDQAIREALARNYAIKVQSYGVPIARAGVTEAFGKFDVTLNGSYQPGRTNTPYLAAPFSGVRPPADLAASDSSSLSLSGLSPWGLSYQIGGYVNKVDDPALSPALAITSYAGIQVTQPLLQGFGTGSALYQLRVAKTNRAISEWDFRRAVIDTVTQVVDAYSDVLFARAYLRSAQHLLSAAEQLVDENKKRFAVGAMSQFDVLSATAQVADRRQGVIAAQAGLRQTENSLKALVSDVRDPSLLAHSLSLAPFPDQSEPAIEPVRDFHTALTLRPDYQSALLSLKRGEYDQRYYRNQLLPQVDLVASAGVNGIGRNWASSEADLRSHDFPSSSVGVTVSIPLASAAERGRYRAARLRREQARAYLDKLEQDIVVAIGSAAIQVQSARQRVATTQRARELNEKMLDAEVKRLRAGTGSTFAVLYQQQQLGYAEVNEAQAEADYQKSIAEYDRQTGRTLEVHHIDLVMP